MADQLDITERLGRGLLYDAANSHELSKEDIKEAKSVIEGLRTALNKAHVYLSEQLAESLECCCSHNPDGTPNREDIDELSIPMIEEMEGLVAELNAALGSPPTRADGGGDDAA